MKPTRSLALKRETLTHLASDDLQSVVGGSHIRTDCNCITHNNTCDFCNVPTLPVNVCVDRITDAIAVSGGC